MRPTPEAEHPGLVIDQGCLRPAISIARIAAGAARRAISRRVAEYLVRVCFTIPPPFLRSTEPLGPEFQTGFSRPKRHPAAFKGSETALQVTWAKVSSDTTQEKNVSIVTCDQCDQVVEQNRLGEHKLRHQIEDAQTISCAVCTRSPAMPLAQQFQSGFIVFNQRREVSTPVCRVCAQAVFRVAQAHNFTRGPWGPISFFATIAALITNRSRYRFLQDTLDQPQPSAPELDEKLRGTPLRKRPTVIAAVGAVAAVLLWLGMAVTNGELGDSTLEVGDCVNYAGESVFETSRCDSADGMVVSVTDQVFDCSAGTTWYVEMAGDDIACIADV